jgi:hypothetical protein
LDEVTLSTTLGDAKDDFSTERRLNSRMFDRNTTGMKPAATTLSARLVTPTPLPLFDRYCEPQLRSPAALWGYGGADVFTNPKGGIP